MKLRKQSKDDKKKKKIAKIEAVDRMAMDIFDSQQPCLDCAEKEKELQQFRSDLHKKDTTHAQKLQCFRVSRSNN